MSIFLTIFPDHATERLWRFLAGLTIAQWDLGGRQNAPGVGGAAGATLVAEMHEAAAIIEQLKRVLPPASETARDVANLRRAAVLMPLYRVGDELFVLLTRRTDKVEHHKGQISFPGGAADPGEDLRYTALRETHEEIGIPPEEVTVLGALPDVEVTVSGFVVTPFVGLIPHPYPLRICADEIDELVLIPLATFLDPANLRVERRERDGRIYDVYFYNSEGHTVWGATARIIKHLVDLLKAPDHVAAGRAGGNHHR